MRSAIQAAEGAKEVARMRMWNAQFHVDGVVETFGVMSDQYDEAAEILAGTKREFVAACDALGDLLAKVRPNSPAYPQQKTATPTVA